MQVRNHDSYHAQLVVCEKTNVFHSQGSFCAGNLKNHIHEWAKLTSDPHILELASGYKLDFDTFPEQFRKPSCKFSDSETKLISGEITKLLNKGVIVESGDEMGQYVSPIFLRPKKDGNHRMILNLKQLNNTVAYQHFKMDTMH